VSSSGSGSGTAHTVDVRLLARPTSIGQARQALQALAPAMSSTSMDDAKLLVSELVTNSVRYAGMAEGDEVELSADVDPSRRMLRVEVADAGMGFSVVPRVAGSALDAGWGLHIVSQLADTWGLVTGAVTRVWFEIGTDRP
jgi:anti-sigma regulatory factor (Ser/Thr protein kinase)